MTWRIIFQCMLIRGAIAPIAWMTPNFWNKLGIESEFWIMTPKF